MGRTRGVGNGRSSPSFPVVLLVLALVSQAADMASAQWDSPSGRGPSYFNPQSFNPSMAVIIVVLVTAFFFLGFFSIYLRRCAGSPLGPGPGPAGDLLALGAGSGITFAAGAAAAAVRGRTPRGLDPAALRALPTMAYADVKAHRVGLKGELECAVCLSEFDDRDALRLLPRCCHAFHVDCIDAWLASHVTCPVCRANLVFPEASAPAPAMATTVVQPQDVLPAAAATEEVPTAPPEPVTTVAIAVDSEETEEEAAELVRIGSVKRALRSKSGRPPSPAQPVFPRSHTTGHSLAVAAGGAAAERYTLRLPEHVLREAVAAGELRRSKSLQAFRDGGDGTSSRSARRGLGFGFGGAAPRAGRSVRLGQSGRWPTMSALLARTFSSARLPAAWGASARRGEADDAPGKVESNAAAATGQRCDVGAGAACPLPLGGGRV
ncbi:E3 ubiquitin-protein ligase ATL6 [Brachypodium distachyon]|uniref:RING-type E3 ubiquitin transferase n=1 Tax=Brachypodium distachyon TaxID=15368 RepID=A0A2K2D212_BRADI|nr:E3 ubiquitin-protein ligase ATL6 [Brachypodium distachyon]PNT68308.1 hypothetical protein BRADI_3g38493v3 [Brachypodium distachyon]|eukprot:XP_003572301.1 E3 ubiquitin-protein ligase ATL6 [Brachypodium distachyon]